jgi:hypothetical protein
MDFDSSRADDQPLMKARPEDEGGADSTIE